MKTRIQRFPKIGLTVLCIVAILAAYFPFSLLSSPVSADTYTRQELDFEDPDDFGFSSDSALSLDGLPQQDGYLFGQNTSESTQQIVLNCPVIAGEMNTVGFDFLISEMPSEGNLIFTTEIADGTTTVSSQQMKMTVYTEVEKWYHYETDVIPKTKNVTLNFSLVAGVEVLFDNLETIDGNGKTDKIDAETAAGNYLYFDWVLKNETAQVRKDNRLFRIKCPDNINGGKNSHYFAFSFKQGDDESTALSKKLTVNKNYKLRFDYYYLENNGKGVSTEEVKLRIANNATSDKGSLNTSFDLTANQPKFETWYTYETEFTAKNRQTTYWTIEVGAGVSLYIDNVEFVDAVTGGVVLAADFSNDYAITVASYTERSIYAIENGPDVYVVKDWVASVINNKSAKSYTYINDFNLSEKLDANKKYKISMDAFIGRNAKTLIGKDKNTKNFEIEFGSKIISTRNIGDLGTDEWQTFTTPEFQPAGFDLCIRAYQGLIAYFDNIQIIDAATNKAVVTCKIERINTGTYDVSYNLVGEKMNRRSVRAGLAKNRLLHINTPIRSKMDHVLDIRFDTPDLPGKLVVGQKYLFTADLYYFDNGYTAAYDGGEMHNNFPTMRVGSGNGQYCEVFRTDRRTYGMGSGTGQQPYGQWFQVKGGSYGINQPFVCGDSSDNVYYNTMGVKVWCGTEVYIDNMTVTDLKGNIVYQIDFEDESMSYVCWDESVGDNEKVAPVPKGSFSIEAGPEVAYGEVPPATDYAVHASSDTVKVIDEEFNNLKPDIDYRVSFNYYMKSAADSDELFSLYAVKDGSNESCGLAGTVKAGSNRTAERWEKASYIAKLSDLADGLAIKAAPGTSVYIDDIVISDYEFGGTVANVPFTASTVVQKLDDSSVPISKDAPSKLKMVKVTEPKLSMGYLRAVADKNAAKTGKLGAVNGKIKPETNCKYEVEFPYYQARESASGNTLFTVGTDPNIVLAGSSEAILTVRNGVEGEWKTASFLFEIGKNATGSASDDWMIFNISAGAAVYIDDLSVTKYLEETNEEIGVLDFEKADSTKYVAMTEHSARLTKSEIIKKGFQDNGSGGYLYIENSDAVSADVAFVELKNIQLKTNTNYALTFDYCSKKATGAVYAFAFGTQHLEPETNSVKSHYDYYNNVEKGWSSKTIYFSTTKMVPAANYFRVGVYGGQELLFDNFTLREVVSPTPVKERVLTFDEEDPTIYPSTTGFRRVTNAEIKKLYPKLASTIGESKGFLYGYSNEPRQDRALNYDIHGIALRSHSEYNINVRYMILNHDTNPDDEYTFDHYCALGTNYGMAGSWSMKTFVSKINDHQWRTMTLSIVTEEVVPDIAYFVIPLYYGCDVLFDNFTVTEVANYEDSLYCEDLYSQLDNYDFESKITKANWAPLSDGMKVVSDPGDSGRKANKHVMQISGDALDGSTYFRRFPLVTNNNYILSLWVKADPDSDITVGVYGNAGGKNFKDLFLTEDGNIPFGRDGKWHRVNIAFGSGIYDEGFLLITGTKGNIRIDDVDLYFASQGISSLSVVEKRTAKLMVLPALSFDIIHQQNIEEEEDPAPETPTTYKTVTKTNTETVRELVPETCYRTDTSLTTWEEVVEDAVTYKPEYGKRVRKTVTESGGDFSAGAYICIAAVIVLVLSLAAFFLLLFLGKKKKSGGAEE